MRITTRLLAALVGLFALVAALPGAALAGGAPAGYQDTQIYDAYAGSVPTTALLRTPRSYGAGCDAGSDAVTAYNTGPTPVAIQGQIILKQNNHGVLEVLQTWPITFTVPGSTAAPGIALLTIAYPYMGNLPVADAFGIKELHIDVQLGNIGGGDWDVYSYCTTPSQQAQGCTPGYWKNHPEAWPIATTTTLTSAFSGAQSTTYATSSLLQSLSLQGGPGVAGAQQILFRVAAAAFLNAVDQGVAYKYTVAQVQSMVNGALASNDRVTIIDTVARLDAANNAGCSKR